MRLLFSIDRDKQWTCTAEYDVAPGTVYKVVGTAMGSAGYTGDPFKLFRDALKKFPVDDKSAKLFTVASWRAALEPVDFMVMDNPSTIASYVDSSDYIADVTLKTYSVKVHWKSPVLDQNEAIGLTAHEANKASSVGWVAPIQKWVFEQPKEIQDIEKMLQAKAAGNGQAEVTSELSKHFDMTQKLRCHKDCPLDGGKEVRLDTYVWHLNDKQGWTINKIADHLEELPINIQQQENAVTA